MIRRKPASQTDIGQGLLQALSPAKGKLCAELARDLGLSGTNARRVYQLLSRLKAEQLTYNDGYYWYLGTLPLRQ